MLFGSVIILSISELEQYAVTGRKMVGGATSWRRRREGSSKLHALPQVKKREDSHEGAYPEIISALVSCDPLGRASGVAGMCG